MEGIFLVFGIEIIKRDEKIFIRYDEGELVIKMTENEITKEEAIKAQKGEMDVYEALLACERSFKNVNNN